MVGATFEDFNMEVYLAEVGKRPELWNHYVEEYHEKTTKQNAWLEVCAALSEEFEEKNDVYKQKIAQRLKKKWRNIKDNYIKSVKRKTRYKYKHLLGFLKPILKKSKTQSTIDLDYVKTEATIASDPLIDLNQSTSTEEPFFSYISPTRFAENKRKRKLSDASHPPTCPSRSTNPFENSDDSDAAVEAETTPANQSFNADRSFFESILPSLSIFDEDEKLEFRTDVLDIIRKMRKAKMEK